MSFDYRAGARARAARRWAASCSLALAFAVLLWACDSSSTTTTTPTTPTPPVVTNTPPVIQSISVSSPRVEAGQTVQLTATVTDAESDPSTFTYAWSASPSAGTFTGTGASVSWKAPSGQPTPQLYTFTLTVTETFKSAGQVKTNVVASSAASVHYNDSVAEVGGLVVQFLTDFATFGISPAQCVRNFSDSCRGKTDELNDITFNRQNFHILSADLGTPNVTLNGDRTFANISISCVFYDIPNSTGNKERVPGLCTLTGVYENFQWFLCDSHFTSTGPVTPANLQYRVPGRLISSDRLEP